MHCGLKKYKPNHRVLWPQSKHASDIKKGTSHHLCKHFVGSKWSEALSPLTAETHFGSLTKPLHTFLSKNQTITSFRKTCQPPSGGGTPTNNLVWSPKKEEPTSPGRPRSGPKRTPRHFQRAFARALAGRVGAHRGDGVALWWGGGLPTQMPPRLCYLFDFVICWNQKNIILSLGILFGRTRKTLLQGKVFVNPTCDLRNNHENLVTIFWNFCSFEMLFLCSWQKSLKYLDFYIENVCPVVSLCKTRKILSGMCKNEGG